MKRSIITILAVAAVLAGCKKGSEVNGGTGTLTIKSLTAESVLNDKNISTGNTKSLPSELADPSDFDITISSNLQGGNSQSYKFADIADKTLELPAGSYTIKAESHDKATAAWNQPIFEGSKEFSIVAGAVTPVEVKCYLTNAMVSVKYSDLFLTELSEYEVKVTGADGNFLTWDKNTAADKDGYFAAGDLEVRIDGIRSLDNSQASISGTIKNVKAKDHIILNIDAKLTGETSSITVSIDGTVMIECQIFSWMVSRKSRFLTLKSRHLIRRNRNRANRTLQSRRNRPHQPLHGPRIRTSTLWSSLQR